MKVFNCFFKIAAYKKKMILMYVVIFAVICLIFSSFGKTEQQSYTGEAVDIAVVDRDHSPLSRALTDDLEQKNNVRRIKYEKKKIQDQLFYRTIEYVLVIPKGFQEGTKSLENIKIPSSSTGYLVDAQIEQYMKLYQGYQKGGWNTKDSIRLTAQTLDKTVSVTWGSKPTATQSKIFYFFQYLPYIFLALMGSALSPVFMVFFRKEIRQRNLCSPMSEKSRNRQLILGSILFSFGCWALFMIIAAVIYREQMLNVHISLLFLNSLSMMLVSMAIAFLMGAAIGTTSGLNGCVNTVALGSSFLGGVFIPLEILDSKVLTVSRLIPAYWYSKCNAEIAALTSINRSVVEPLLRQMGVQLLFAALILVAAGIVCRCKMKQ